MLLAAVGACGNDPTAVLEVQDMTITTMEDTPISISVPVTGASPQVQITLSAMPAHGVAAPSDGGMVWTYTPAANYNGPDSLSITFANGTDQQTGTAHITVMAMNDAPVANPDNFATPFDTTATFDDATLLANDTDVDSTTLTVVSVASLSHGTADHAGTRTTFVPEAGYSGSATFSYTISDGDTTATALVTVTVGANSPPVAVDDTVATNEDTAVQIPVSTLLANDSDPEHQTLALSTIDQATHGTVIRQDAMITFTPDPDYNGIATFQYGVTDGAATSTATVTINIAPVNDPPVVPNVGGLDLAEDVAMSIPSSILLAGATDVDGDLLRVAAVGSPQHGTVSMSPAGDSVTFMPDPNYNGPAGFTFTVTDGAASVSAAVAITVTPVNDPPVAVDDAFMMNEDTTLTTSAAALLANDLDIDADTLVVTALSNATHGTATLLGSSIQFTPAPNYNGPAGFDYTISDGAATAMAHVAIVVLNVNDPPVANDDAIATNEDTAGTVNVLANDTDVDGDALSIASFSQGAHGTVAFSGGIATYTPSANYNGLDEFTYTATDSHGGLGTATVRVTIAAVNDAPVANDDTIAINEDTTGTVNVLANDTDVDGDALSIGSFSQAAHGTVAFAGGVATYAPSANYNGLDQFTYTATDGHGGVSTATVRVMIAPVNDAPTLVDDIVTINEDTTSVIYVLANDSDVDGDALTVILFSQGGHGTVTFFNNGVAYTPAANYNGSDDFTYTAADGHGGLATATVHVTILPVNDAPIAAGDAASTLENGAVAIDVLANDSDVDGDLLAIQTVTNPAHGAAAVQVDQRILYTPAASFSGSDSFGYTISDGHGGVASATVIVTITPINQAPVANDDHYVTDQTSALAVAAPGVLGNDVDPDSVTLTAQLVSAPDCGTLALDANGSFTYTPGPSGGGLCSSTSFTYRVSDGALTSNTATVTIGLNPTAVADAYSYTDGADATNNMFCFASLADPPSYDCYNFDSLLANDTASGSATIVLDSPAGCVADGSTCQLANGTLSMLEIGTFDYFPSATCGASETFSYHVVDGSATSASVPVTIALPCVAAVGTRATKPAAPVHASAKSN